MEFLFQFLVIKTQDSDSLEMLDPDPNSMDPDPSHCMLAYLFTFSSEVRENMQT